jgi:hypothetical protein
MGEITIRHAHGGWKFRIATQPLRKVESIRKT